MSLWYTVQHAVRVHIPVSWELSRFSEEVIFKLRPKGEVGVCQAALHQERSKCKGLRTGKNGVFKDLREIR